MKDSKRLVVSMLGLFVISLIFTCSVFETLNGIIAEIQVSVIDGDEWTEVCYEYRTVNRSKIIYPIKDGCYRICEKHMGRNEGTESCIECFNATEPYIYTWQETTCARYMLVTERYGNIISDTYGQ